MNITLPKVKPGKFTAEFVFIGDQAEMVKTKLNSVKLKRLVTVRVKEDIPVFGAFTVLVNTYPYTCTSSEFLSALKEVMEVMEGLGIVSSRTVIYGGEPRKRATKDVPIVTMNYFQFSSYHGEDVIVEAVNRLVKGYPEYTFERVKVNPDKSIEYRAARTYTQGCTLQAKFNTAQRILDEFDERKLSVRYHPISQKHHKKYGVWNLLYNNVNYDNVFPKTGEDKI